LFWRHVVAASEQVETAGNQEYHEDHMATVFKKGFSFSGYERDLLSISRGDGTFLNISGVSGVDSISDGRGSVMADFDNDGDLDIFLTTAQGEAHYMFRNNIGNSNQHLRVTLVGTTAGTDAWGAVVRIKGPTGVQTKVKAGGAAFLSQNDPRLLFGLGQTRQIEWLEVTWPGGGVTRLENLEAGQSIRIVQGDDGYKKVTEQAFNLVDPLDPQEQFLSLLGFRKGEMFPDLDLTSPSGESRSMQQVLRPGRKTLVNLWATWCVPCAKEMPELQALYPSLGAAGVDLVGVSVDLDTAGAVSGMVSKREVTYPILITDENGLESLYPTGQATVPVSILLDEDGTVLEIYPGWSAKTERALRKLAGL
jgi:thiol-disulfide isomerase/thioredoxin